jgi:hypothetical protein
MSAADCSCSRGGSAMFCECQTAADTDARARVGIDVDALRRRRDNDRMRAVATIAKLVRLDRTLGFDPASRTARSIHDVLGAWSEALPHVASAIDTLGVVGSIRTFRAVARVLAEGTVGK